MFLGSTGIAQGKFTLVKNNPIITLCSVSPLTFVRPVIVVLKQWPACPSLPSFVETLGPSVRQNRIVLGNPSELYGVYVVVVLSFL